MRPRIAAFVVSYCTHFGPATKERTEARFTTTPPPVLLMARIAALAQKAKPFRFTPSGSVLTLESHENGRNLPSTWAFDGTKR